MGGVAVEWVFSRNEASKKGRTGMTHSRVTPTGQALGRSAARMAELGRQRLEQFGLADLQLPKLRDDMCPSCACRRDTVPNGCLQTQLDFLKAVADGQPFLCHAPLDGKLCAGWVRARAEVVANPLPEQVVKLIGKWEYTAPDAEMKAARAAQLKEQL